MSTRLKHLAEELQPLNVKGSLPRSPTNNEDAESTMLGSFEVLARIGKDMNPLVDLKDLGAPNLELGTWLFGTGSQVVPTLSH